MDKLEALRTVRTYAEGIARENQRLADAENDNLKKLGYLGKTVGYLDCCRFITVLIVEELENA